MGTSQMPQRAFAILSASDLKSAFSHFFANSASASVCASFASNVSGTNGHQIGARLIISS